MSTLFDIALEEDLELIGDLDFKFEQACEYTDCVPLSADFFVKCRFCPKSRFMCSGHLEQMREWCADAILIQCEMCGTAGIDLDQMVVILPLKL